jgi:hypothetical protein
MPPSAPLLRGGVSGLDPGSASKKRYRRRARGIASISTVPLMSFIADAGRFPNRRARHNQSPINGTPGRAVLRRRGRSSIPTDRRPSEGPKVRIRLPLAESRANFRFLSGGVGRGAGIAARFTAPAYWKFESIPLQRRVNKLSVPFALSRYTVLRSAGYEPDEFREMVTKIAWNLITPSEGSKAGLLC